jgi:hypothetical protein
LYLQILEKKNRQLLSIISIQKYIRVFNAKRKLISIYREVLEKNRLVQSLVTIQKYIRLFNAKRKFLNYLQLQKGREQELMQKRREEAKRKYEISAMVIQKYIRAWHCRREMIGLVVQKLLELREYELKKVKELEEQRKILQDGKPKDYKRQARLSKTIDALTDSSISTVKPSIRPITLNQSQSALSSADQYPDPKSSRKTKKPTTDELQRLDSMIDSQSRKDVAGPPISRLESNSSKDRSEEMTSPRGNYLPRRNILSTIGEKIPSGPSTPKAAGNNHTLQKLTTNFSKIHGFWAHAVTKPGPATARGVTPPKPHNNGVSSREIKKPELTPAQKKMLRRSRSLDSVKDL